MPTSRDRLWATVVIWVAVTVITLGIVAAIAFSPLEIAVAGTLIPFVATVVMVLLGAAGFATSRIWSAGQAGQADQSAAGNEAEAEAIRKRKRQRADRITRLVDDLDENELVELETLLMARDEDLM